MRSIGFVTQMALVILFFLTLVTGSPVKDDSLISYADFNERFEAVYRGDGVPLRRVHHRHLYKRDLHHELFRPAHQLNLDVMLGGSVQTFSFEHSNAIYVNLELLQVHGLIRHDVPICSDSDRFNETMLNILFRDHGSYVRAKEHWQGRNDLLFIVEDASCIEGEGTRSSYSSTSVSFSENRPGVPIAVQIRAQPKRLAVDEPETATTLEISSKTIKQTLSETIGMYKLHRRRLTQRGWPLDDITDKVNDLKDDVKEVPGKVKDLAKTGLELLKQEMVDLYEEIQAHMDVDVGKDLTLTLDMPREERHMPLEKIQKLGFTPKLTLIDSYANGSLDVGFTMKFNVMPKAEFLGLSGDKEDKYSSYLKEAFKETSIFMTASEEINIGLQMEFVVPAGAELFCAWWLTPTPVFISCRNLIMNNGEKPKIKIRKGVNRDTVQPLNTTPGFDVRIPKGAVGKIGFKDGKQVHENIESHVTWRAPHIELQDSKIYASVAIGPRLTLDAALPGIQKFAFSMSSRLDLPKVEIALGQTTAVDEYCRDKAVADGGIEEAVGVWVEIAAGWYANIVMPYGTIIDTNWLGKRLGPEFQGFMWSKKLGGICRNESDPDVAGPKYWTNRLNEKFKEMTPKVYMDDKEEDHMKEGEIMKEVKENGGNKEDKEKSLSSGDSTIVSSMGDSTAVSSTRDSTMTSSTTESSSSSGASTTASSTKV